MEEVKIITNNNSPNEARREEANATIENPNSPTQPEESELNSASSSQEISNVASSGESGLNSAPSGQELSNVESSTESGSNSALSSQEGSNLASPSETGSSDATLSLADLLGTLSLMVKDTYELNSRMTESNSALSDDQILHEFAELQRRAALEELRNMASPEEEKTRLEQTVRAALSDAEKFTLNNLIKLRLMLAMQKIGAKKYCVEVEDRREDHMEVEDCSEAEDLVDLDKISEELLALGESIIYNAQSSQDGSTDICVICSLKYKDGDRLTVLRCKHSFHAGCITTLFQSKKLCPVCMNDASSSGSK